MLLGNACHNLQVIMSTGINSRMRMKNELHALHELHLITIN